VASRANIRPINPAFPAPVKKDNSHLDWHYKVPTDEELSDPYECFPDEFWAPYFQAAKEATTLPPRKKKDPLQLKESIKRDACEDCSLPYQLLMQRLGKCKPADGASTPADRLGLEGES
jgi:hypothetical protein